MTFSVSFVLLLSGVVTTCTAIGILGYNGPGFFLDKTDYATNPKYSELAHFATSTWSAQRAGKTNFDTVKEVLKVEMQIVVSEPGPNYRLQLKVAESICPLTSTYTKEACTPKEDAEERTCSTGVYEDSQGAKSVIYFRCPAA